MRLATRALVLVALAALGACSIDGVTFTGGNPDASPDAPKDAPMIDMPMGPLGIIVSGSTLMVNEGQTRGLMISLSQPPPGALLVTLESSDDTRIGVNPTAVLFSSTDWNSPQSVTITGKQDVDAADEAGRITLRSTAVANPVQVDVNVDDDDGLSLALSATSLDVGEGSTGTLSVHLTAQPATSVTVTVMSTNTAAATTSQSMLVFTPANYAIDQTITITGLQDADTINNMFSIDFAAALLMPTSLPIQVTDDDVLGISTSTSSLQVTEGGTQMLNVTLTQMPPADTTITIISNNTAVATVSPAMVMFTTANWNTPQAVTATAVHDDNVADGSTTLTLAATGLTTRSVTVSVTEDDVQAIVAAPSTLSVVEGGTSQLALSLAFRPAADVTMTVMSLDSMAATAGPAMVTFTVAAYNVPQMITVTGVQDADAVPDLTAVRVDALALSLTRDITVNVTEDDTLTIEASPGTVAVNEGSTSNLQIRLTSQPTAPTTVSIGSSAPSLAVTTPTSVQFTTSNWNVFQPVTVNGVEDGDLVGGTATLTLSAPGIPNTLVTVNVTDNDMQAVVPALTTVPVTEGTNTTVGVTLAYMPTADVTVTVASMNSAIAGASPTMLTFNAGNYSTPQNIMISGTEDADAVNNSTMVTLMAPGATTGTITVNVTDNDGLNIQISPTSLTIGEASSGALQVRLTAAPTATTMVMIASGDTGAATVSPAMLTFTTTNYGTFQPVTVSGVDDPDAANEMVTITATSAGVPNATATVNVTDNEVQTIVRSPPTVTLAENGMTTFSVHLGAQPGGNTTVMVTSGDVGAATVSTSMLTFTMANYAMDQVVTVTGVQDADATNESIGISLTSPGVMPASVTANVTDDDTQAILVAPTSVNIAEGGSANVNVTLQYQPIADVVVNVAPLDGALVAVGQTSLTFNSANYTTPQTVSISGREDDNAANGSTSVNLTSPGAIPASVTVNVTDNDVLAIDVTPAALNVGENMSRILQVRLTAQPPAGTTVNLMSDDPGAASLSATSVNFSTANWNIFQDVTVFGVDDPDSASENVTITLTSMGLTTKTASVSVTDDDNVMILATPSSVGVVEGGVAGFNVSLTSPPAGPVTISVASLDPSVVGVGPPTLNFTPANYNIGQPVNVFGVQDQDLVNESASINLSAPSIPTVSVTANVTDDDTQRILLGTTALNVNEGASEFVNVSLLFEPVGTVFVNVVSNNPQILPSPMMVQFDASNYSIPQQIQVFALFDPDFDESEADLTFSGAGAMPENLHVTLVEPDIIEQPGFTDPYICEGFQVALPVRLQGRPINPVQVSVVTSFELDANPTVLFFDSNDWFNYQTVFVTGQNPGTGQLNLQSPGYFTKAAQIDVFAQPCLMSFQ